MCDDIIMIQTVHTRVQERLISRKALLVTVAPWRVGPDERFPQRQTKLAHSFLAFHNLNSMPHLFSNTYALFYFM